MRVLVITSRHQDERGAVAIVVAVCLLVLLGISGFVVDFGLAYTNERQLQTAADAAVLAAAAVYADEPGGCATFEGNSALETEARAAAGALMQDNHAEASVVGDIFVACSTDGSGRWRVTWTNENATDVGLGGVFGAQDIVASATAAAEVGVASQVTGVLPYALCLDDALLVNLQSLPTGPVQIDYASPTTPGSPDPDCPGDADAASWWLTTCPDNATGNAALTTNTEDGCSDVVSRVDGQASFTGDPIGLSGHLLGACPGGGGSDEDCLASQPGVLSDWPEDDAIWRAWEEVVQGSQRQQVVLPVFCGAPRCNPPAAGQQYPVHGFVSAWVCAYHWKEKPPSHASDDVETVSSSDPCFDTPEVDVDDALGDDGFLILSFVPEQVGGSVTPADCALGDSFCDFGVRMTRLVR